MNARSGVTLGLAANWRQFALLVVVNAFVGAMVGLERSVVPLLGASEFGLSSRTEILGFIAAFGLAKAFANLISGWLADRGARKRTLVAGWLIALPVPLLILAAPNWWWIMGANALLGFQQGLTWSMTVIMKVDLVGPRRRGLAMGLNEFAGYVALAAAAVVSGIAAAHFGARQGVAYPALVVAAAGLVLSLIVRDTSAHVKLESRTLDRESASGRPPLRAIIRRSLWKDRALFSISQAGLVNNLNDGLSWGLLPLILSESGVSIEEASWLIGTYPAAWGISQLATGPLSDRIGRKVPIVAGMLLQGVALLSMTLIATIGDWSIALVSLGVGTALVYPALLAAVSDIAHPSWRGGAIGVYRLWRDLGYVVGALLAGGIADVFGTTAAIAVVGALTAFSGIVVAVRLPLPAANAPSLQVH